jgi:hypothetical protein
MILTVRYRNYAYAIRDRYASYLYIPEYFDYTGEVLPSPKWVKDDSFCLSGGGGKYDLMTNRLKELGVTRVGATTTKSILKEALSLGYS